MLQDERQNIRYDRDFCYKIAKGETALHIAAKRGHKELAELLIAKGWDPESRNYKMESPGGLASNFLKSVRNGIKERVKSEEIKCKCFCLNAIRQCSTKLWLRLNGLMHLRMGG